jgi:hypothetical protein
VTPTTPENPTAASAVEATARALLATHDTTGLRRLAYDRIAEQASLAYGTAFHLSGGGDGGESAHDAGLHNAVHHIAPSIVAFALHHLGAVLPDLTIAQWERLDQAAIALDLRVCEDLSAANGPGPAGGRPGMFTRAGGQAEVSSRPSTSAVKRVVSSMTNPAFAGAGGQHGAEFADRSGHRHSVIRVISSRQLSGVSSTPPTRVPSTVWKALHGTSSPPAPAGPHDRLPE